MANKQQFSNICREKGVLTHIGCTTKVCTDRSVWNDCKILGIAPSSLLKRAFRVFSSAQVFVYEAGGAISRGGPRIYYNVIVIV